MTPGAPASRRPTLADVARESGVSVALASIVMRGAEGASEASRTKVKAAALKLGYRPDSRARALRSLRSGLLGVTLVLDQPFHAELVDEIYAAAERHGYEVVLGAIGKHRCEARALEGLADSGCEAILAIAPISSIEELTTLDTQLPLISLLRDVPGIESVCTDDHTGIDQAVAHLVSLGHRDILHLDGGSAVAAAERRTAYKNAMERFSLGEMARIVPAGSDERAGSKAIARLLAGDSGTMPSALLVFNDRCALGVIDALERAGMKIPQDLSVVGFDDSQFAALTHIGLSSVRQDVQALADTAVTRALARLSGQSARLSMHAPQLVVRQSIGPAPTP